MGGIEFEAKVGHGAEHALDTGEAVEIARAVEGGGALDDAGRQAGGREGRGFLRDGHDGGVGVECEDSGGGHVEERAVGGMSETGEEHF